MNIDHLVVVLGKRLQGNKLTREGRSRIDALTEYLDSHARPGMAVAFCGGVTAHQTVSEASRMWQYFRRLRPEGSYPLAAELLEENSTSTVENFRMLARELLSSGLASEQQTLKVTLVSNDYHLQRIFEIQSLLDEQGLLRVLKARCEEAGLRLDLSYQLSDHVCAPYPHDSDEARLFLAIEALTTYRVYLEGTVAGVFEREAEQVRAQPYHIARQALDQAETLCRSADSSGLAAGLLPLLKQCVEQTGPERSREEIIPWLACFDTNLTMLNRFLDPETDGRVRWWKG